MQQESRKRSCNVRNQPFVFMFVELKRLGYERNKTESVTYSQKLVLCFGV